MAPLAGLTNLQSLDLNGTQVSDVAPLAGLTNLQSLDLRGTQVSDVAPLAGMIGTKIQWDAPAHAKRVRKRARAKPAPLRSTAAAGRS